MSFQRRPAFGGLPAAARAYVLGMLLTAGAVATTPAALWPTERSVDLWVLAALAVLCAGATVFEVFAPGNHSLQPNLVFFAGATLLLPVWAVALIALVCFCPQVAKGVAWFKATFNAANYVLAAAVTQAFVSIAGVPLGSEAGVAAAAVLTAAGVVFVTVNHLLLVPMIALAHTRRAKTVVKGLADTLMLDLAMATTGVLAALLWTVAPAAVVLCAGPLGLIYRTMWIPMLEHRSRTDAKTGLFNFAHFREELSGALASARRDETPVSVLMVDLDGLRGINSEYGHLAGDLLLVAVAREIEAAIGERGIVARFGGDEFSVLLPRTTAPVAREMAEQLRRRLRELRAGDRNLHTTVSVGVAAFPEHAEDEHALLEAADRATYDAKASGRNCVRMALTPLAEFILALNDGRDEPEPLAGTVASAGAAQLHGGSPMDPEAPEAAPERAAPSSEDGPSTGMARRHPRRLIPLYVAGLLTATAVMAAVSSSATITEQLLLFGVLTAAVLLLDSLSIDLFEKGNVSPASVPSLVLAFVFGPLGPLAAEIVVAVRRAVRREPFVRWAFDVGALGLAGGAAALVFGAVEAGDNASLMAGAAAGGLAYYLVNIPLLAVVMALSEGRKLLEVFRERLSWLAPHYVVFGVLAGGVVITEHSLGPYALAVFGVPVVALLLTERQYITRSRSSVAALRRSHDELTRVNARLTDLLADNQDLLRSMHRSYLSTITSLARTIEAKDPYTGGHTERVASLACLLARELDFPSADLDALEVGGIIHDIGKVGIPDAVLLKPGRLTDDEFAEMRRHPEMSSYIIGELELPPIVKQMARSHHERYDGGGYPDGLVGTEIPLPARILSVADTLDAMTSDRPYRTGVSLSDAVAEITRLAGAQFCPRVVAALHECLRRDVTLGALYDDATAPSGAPGGLLPAA